MSIIVVAKKNNVVVIGADTLTRFNDIRESSTYISNKSKIVKFRDNYIAAVGHASIGLVLDDYFTHYSPKADLSSAEHIFKESLRMHAVFKSDFFLNPKEDEEDPFESLQTHILIMNPHGIFGLYSLRSVQEYSKFYAFGSGYELALGAMYTAYEGKAKAEDIAAAGLEAACEFDSGCARPYEIFQQN